MTQENHRYSMLPLTREYALAELKAHPDFEREARDRWIGWYLSFSQRYAGQDAKEWQQFDGLGEWHNLQAVIEWCIRVCTVDRLETCHFLYAKLVGRDCYSGRGAG